MKKSNLLETAGNIVVKQGTKEQSQTIDTRGQRRLVFTYLHFRVSEGLRVGQQRAIGNAVRGAGGQRSGADFSRGRPRSACTK